MPRLEYDLMVVKLLPDDVLVIGVPSVLQKHEAEALLRYARLLFPNNRVGILDGGKTIDILREEKTCEAVSQPLTRSGC